MRLIILLTSLLVVCFLVLNLIDFSQFANWVFAQQRAFQNEIADAVYGLQGGERGALTALFAAAGAYGFVHALGPGHGKYVIGGVGLGSDVSAAKLLSLAVASSLAQAFMAICLVYGGFALLSISARQAAFLAEDVFAPASFVAIAAVGAVLVWRGGRIFAKRTLRSLHNNDHACASCGHLHGPSAEQIASIGSLKDAALVVGSIAIRPCTGAVLLLVIAWQMNFPIAGAAAVVVMGLGTAALTSAVAVSSVFARIMTITSAQSAGVVSTLAPAAQILVGLCIVWISLMLLLFGGVW